MEQEHWLDRFRVVRRVIVAVSLLLTAQSILWGQQAAIAGVDGVTIAAVTAPVALLVGAIAKFYFEARQ